jgi:ABC-type transport system involved in multi-copper enzyme maturation permease subunit
MIWLTWRQFRASAAMIAGALAVLAVFLVATGPGLADDYAAGIATCTGQNGGCSDFVQQFFRDNRGMFLATTAVALVLPALIGLFCGAPLIARELEAGTHRLVWNQSVTRGHWLAVKLGLVGVATVTAAGAASLAVMWWASPVDDAAVDDFARMEPLLFAARGIAPIGYAAFAFALGVAVGMLVRRTLPSMAITLAVFVALQIAMPLVRQHLVPPIQSTLQITNASLDAIQIRRNEGPVRILVRAPESGDFSGAWILSSQAVDASGKPVDVISMSISGPCALPEDLPSEPGLSAACVAAMKRLGYRLQVSYQPADRFWTFQALETAIFLGLALALSGFCFWWLRHRLS